MLFRDLLEFFLVILRVQEILKQVTLLLSLVAATRNDYSFLEELLVRQEVKVFLKSLNFGLALIGLFFL